MPGGKMIGAPCPQGWPCIEAVGAGAQLTVWIDDNAVECCKLANKDKQTWKFPDNCLLVPSCTSTVLLQRPLINRTNVPQPVLDRTNFLLSQAAAFRQAPARHVHRELHLPLAFQGRRKTPVAAIEGQL